MDENELKDLENPENWDWENAETEPGTKNRRTILSVAFPRGDFKKVAECARELGVTVSAFVRDAALEMAETVSRASRKTNWISPEPGTYAGPSDISPITWQVSRQGTETQEEGPPLATNARPLRAIELMSS